MIRHRHLRAALLLCFLALYVPGYGLHAVVGIEHRAKPAADGGCCAFCGVSQTRGAQQQAGDEQTTDERQCSVCKLIATVATMDAAFAISTGKLVAQRVLGPQPRVTSSLSFSHLARGPPE